jgi:hypothetical protein
LPTHHAAEKKKGKKSDSREEGKKGKRKTGKAERKFPFSG